MIVPIALYIYLVVFIACVVLLPHGIIRRNEVEVEASALTMMLSFIGFMSNLYYGLRWL
jgi:hypothetical protein